MTAVSVPTTESAPTTTTESAPTSGQASQPEAHVRAPRRVAISLLRAYQGGASGRVSPCRFYPSCSNYAVEAFEVHGFWRATALTARRLLRCRPFGPHGVDLVPLSAHDHRRKRKP